MRMALHEQSHDSGSPCCWSAIRIITLSQWSVGLVAARDEPPTLCLRLHLRGLVIPLTSRHARGMTVTVGIAMAHTPDDARPQANDIWCCTLLELSSCTVLVAWPGSVARLWSWWKVARMRDGVRRYHLCKPRGCFKRCEPGQLACRLSFPGRAGERVSRGVACNAGTKASVSYP